jgi:carbon storage regulator
MLCLSRKVGEEIMIGPGIRVVVIRIDGDKVKLGFCAPQEVKILRRELKRRDKEGENVRDPRD